MVDHCVKTWQCFSKGFTIANYIFESNPDLYEFEETQLLKTNLRNKTEVKSTILINLHPVGNQINQ